LPLNPSHLIQIKKLEGQMKNAAKSMATISSGESVAIKV
jgi:hypothetical protein